MSVQFALVLRVSSMLAIAQGFSWDWQSPLHQSLRGELQAVVERVHDVTQGWSMAI